jgi:hypothetical protein
LPEVETQSVVLINCRDSSDSIATVAARFTTDFFPLTDCARTKRIENSNRRKNNHRPAWAAPGGSRTQRAGRKMTGAIEKGTHFAAAPLALNAAGGGRG